MGEIDAEIVLGWPYRGDSFTEVSRSA